MHHVHELLVLYGVLLDICIVMDRYYVVITRYIYSVIITSDTIDGSI